jgi:hypothetical protein
MRHDTLAREIAVLLDKRAHSPVSIHRGRYDWESTLIMKLGAVGTLAQRMIEVLVDTARLFGHGEEYKKIITILEDYRDYLKQAHKVTTTGCDWEDHAEKEAGRKLAETHAGEGVFGLSWSQIEKMQGGKIELK